MTLLTLGDWTGSLYNGPKVSGWRVVIQPVNFASVDAEIQHYLNQIAFSDRHVSGHADPVVTCPDCSSPMCAFFSFDNRDPRISSLGIWNLDRLDVFVCVDCDLIYGDYWVTFGDTISIASGKTWTEGRMMQIDKPFQVCSVALVPLEAEDFPTTARLHRLLKSGHRLPRVLHQVGGVPYASGYASMMCIHCNLPMQFAGVICTDEIFRYFSEKGRSRCFRIGDGDCLHYFTCQTCCTIGTQFVPC